MKALTPLLSLIVLFTIGCENNVATEQPFDLNGKIVQDDQLKSEINSAPTEISIEGITYIVEAFVWRDFQPSIGPSSTRLMSLNRLVRTDKKEIPDYIVLIQQYVVNNSAVWIPNYDQESRPEAKPYQKEEISRYGPLWEVGITVDVGIEILNEKTDEKFLLSAPQAIIEKAS
ncbi:MAG TPA: hypothetical protein VF181_07220 [Balneolaceae bacterium]